ncbi:MAG: YbaK/EbsC family protein [bacterium]|nr:YbaK/EbsC family protein [bacterium]
MSLHQQLLARLRDAGCKFETSHHEPTRTSEDAARIRGVAMHSGAKALVTRGHKTGTYYLFVIPADLKLDSKKVKAIVQEEVGFASDVEQVTGCVPGSVPPFGSLFGMRTITDRRLADNEIINFNAASLTDSVAMRYDDYLRVENPDLRDIAK